MRTLGIEEEMLLVDVHDGRPRSVSGQLLVRAARRHAEEAVDGVHGAVEGEFQQQQIETHTPPTADLDTLRQQVRHWRAEAGAAARGTGSSVAALATSPLPVRPVPVVSRRYAWLQERYQLTAREHLVCGCHVHVSVADDEEGVGVLDRIGVWLPALLALSANSPYWNGQDSGFASYRSQALARWPSWGPTGRFGSADAYHRLVRDMVLSTVVLDEGMVYFVARLAQHYPTVEIRAADVCFTVEEAVVVAALCRGLVETAAQDWALDRPAPDVATTMLRLATWQAGREGLEGRLLDWRAGLPVPCWTVLESLLDHVGPALEAAGDLAVVQEGLEGRLLDWPTGLPVPCWTVLESLLDHVGPALEAAGDLAVVQEGLARVREEGNGAVRQRAMLARTGRLVDVVAEAVRETALADEP